MDTSLGTKPRCNHTIHQIRIGGCFPYRHISPKTFAHEKNGLIGKLAAQDFEDIGQIVLALAKVDFAIAFKTMLRLPPIAKTAHIVGIDVIAETIKMLGQRAKHLAAKDQPLQGHNHASRIHFRIVPLMHGDLELAAHIGLIAIKRMRTDL